MQHGWGDDHLVEGLVVPPDGKVGGILLLTAAGKEVQTTGKMGWKTRTVFWCVKTAGCRGRKRGKMEEGAVKIHIAPKSCIIQQGHDYPWANH